MNILFIRTTSGVSGAEVYNLYLLSALRKMKDISVHLLTNSRAFLKKLKEKEIPASFVFSPFPEAGTKKELAVAMGWFYVSLFLYLSRIKKLEEDQKIDVVVLESMTEKLFLSSFLKLYGYRVVWIEHGPLFATSRSQMVKWLYRRKVKYADAIIAVSEDTKRDLVNGGVRAKCIHVVYIGLPQTNYKIEKHSTQTIGFVGSVTEEKGIMEFLEVARMLSKKYSKLQFLVVGKGPTLLKAQAYVRNHKMKDSVEFTGYVEDTDACFSRMDILFAPTRHQEGLSLAILEALAHGVVVVARDIGGNRELVKNGKTGFLYKGNAQEAYNTLDMVLKSSTLMKSVQKEARVIVDRSFSMKKNAKKFLTVFHG